MGDENRVMGDGKHYIQTAHNVPIWQISMPESKLSPLPLILK